LTLGAFWNVDAATGKTVEMETKPEISEREAEELIKGMGRVATVVVHDDGHVTAIAISAEPTLRIQNEVDGLLDDIRHKYRIVKKRSNHRPKQLTLQRVPRG